MDLGSMDPSFGPGPWTRSKDRVHGPPEFNPNPPPRKRGSKRKKHTHIKKYTAQITQRKIKLE